MIDTPLYMSPEQAELTSLDIDARSAIYALGVLLYELRGVSTAKSIIGQPKTNGSWNKLSLHIS